MERCASPGFVQECEYGKLTEQGIPHKDPQLVRSVAVGGPHILRAALDLTETQTLVLQRIIQTVY